MFGKLLIVFFSISVIVSWKKLKGKNIYSEYLYTYEKICMHEYVYIYKRIWNIRLSMLLIRTKSAYYIYYYIIHV